MITTVAITCATAAALPALAAASPDTEAPAVSSVRLPQGVTGPNVSFSATVTDSGSGVNKVYLYLDTVAGKHAAGIQLQDNGKLGDAVAKDNRYSATATLALKPGTYTVSILTYDSKYNETKPVVGSLDVSPSEYIWVSNDGDEPSAPSPTPTSATPTSTAPPTPIPTPTPSATPTPTATPAPTVTPTPPAAGADVSPPVVTNPYLPTGVSTSSITASAEVRDSGSGVRKAYLYFDKPTGTNVQGIEMFDGGQNGDTTAKDGRFSIATTTKLPDGSYDVNVLAVDGKYNSGKTKVATVSVGGGTLAWTLVTPAPAPTPSPTPTTPPTQSPTPTPTPTPTGASAITDVILGVGVDESARNLAWYTTATVNGTAQVALKSQQTGSQFPSAVARSFDATGATSTEGSTRYQHAAIDGLAQNTAYVYRVGSGSSWSATYEFTTGTFDGPYEFIMVGDPQIGASGNLRNDEAGWIDTLNVAQQAFPASELVFSVGDQVDSSGNESHYESFLKPEQLRRYPFVPTNGNHDVGSKAYEQHFNTPNLDRTTGNGMSSGSSGGNYWFLYKDVLYLNLNSNYENTASHKTFLQRVLTEQGAHAKWKVVAFHHSIYSVASHSTSSSTIARRAELSTVLSDLGIDIVLMGHDHSYTRSYLMNRGTVAETGGAKPEVTPRAGDVLYITANSASGSKYYSIKDQFFPYAAVMNQEKQRNFSRVQISDDRIAVTTYRSTNLSVVDSVVLHKR